MPRVGVDVVPHELTSTPPGHVFRLLATARDFGDVVLVHQRGAAFTSQDAHKSVLHVHAALTHQNHLIHLPAVTLLRPHLPSEALGVHYQHRRKFVGDKLSETIAFALTATEGILAKQPRGPSSGFVLGGIIVCCRSCRWFVGLTTPLSTCSLHTQ